MPITPLGCVRLGESHDGKMQSIQFTTSKNRGTHIIMYCATLLLIAYKKKKDKCILLGIIELYDVRFFYNSLNGGHLKKLQIKIPSYDMIAKMDLNYSRNLR
jgi:hypothetical protein